MVNWGRSRAFLFFLICSRILDSGIAILCGGVGANLESILL